MTIRTRVGIGQTAPAGPQGVRVPLRCVPPGIGIACKQVATAGGGIIAQDQPTDGAEQRRALQVGVAIVPAITRPGRSPQLGRGSLASASSGQPERHHGGARIGGHVIGHHATPAAQHLALLPLSGGVLVAAGHGVPLGVSQG